MKKSIASLLLLTSILSLSSCSRTSGTSTQGGSAIVGPTGPIGPQGPKGDPGVDGVSVVSIIKTSSNPETNQDVYTIRYSDGSTSFFVITNGKDGSKGIQGLPGENGHSPVITIGLDGYFYVDGVSTGILATGNKGPQGDPGADGRTISSITLESTLGNVSTYKITYSDGSTDSFQVTKGNKGDQGDPGEKGQDGDQGIQGIQGLPGQDGVAPTVTIGDNGNWFINGVDSGVSSRGIPGKDGVTIVSITKTSTEGLVDTYTITYSDESTDTFTVTKGAQGIQGIDGVPGQDGVAPTVTIGENGNWFINGVDSGRSSKGEQGDKGDQGDPGQDGVSVTNIELTSSDPTTKKDTYTITYSNGTTSTFVITNGVDGATGIQGIQGPSGHTPVITIVNGYFYVDGVTTGVYATGSKGDKGDKGELGVKPVHLVTFKDYDDRVLSTVEVNHGGTAVFDKANPVRPATYDRRVGFAGFTFSGWSKSLENITTDLAVYATYEESFYDKSQFGMYPQSEVVDATKISELDASTPDSEGYYHDSTNKYEKLNGVYYLFEPIDWQVLSTDGNRIKVISNYSIDYKSLHNDSNSSITYATSDIREWLNLDFLSKAFTNGTDMIEFMSVDNSINSATDPNNFVSSVNTEDKVTLVSTKEGDALPLNIKNSRFTDYAASIGSDRGYLCRTIGSGGTEFKMSDYYSTYNIFYSINYGDIQTTKNGIRPVLTFDLNGGHQEPESLVSVNYDKSRGFVSGAGKYSYKDTVTLEATPNSGCTFVGWYSDSEYKTLLSTSTSYSFIMPIHNVEVYAKFYDEEWNKNHGVIPVISLDGKTITYGMYPQTNVNDSSLIDVLNTLTNPNEYGYYFYNNEYYFKYSATPYESGYTFDNGITIVSGTIYWFKVEPIKWKVLENNDGEYFITTESLLVNHIYNSNYSDTQSKTDYQGNTDSVYANNYKFSGIRSWLNTDFYNQVFFLDNDNIKTSTVDNSAASTLYADNPYACENTSDKLFLLSAEELTTASYGFAANLSTYDSARQCKITDYARAHGADMDTSGSYQKNGNYYSRSPNNTINNNSGYARSVHRNGHAGYMTIVNFSCCGVRPAMRIGLD